MPSVITKIRILNFKRFRDYTIRPNSQVNILVGDNEVGKSTVLDAIDIVASGNVRKVEAIGIDKLLNIDAVQQFNAGERSYEHLPKLAIELYLDGCCDHTMNGKNNTDGITCDGIRLVCEPNLDFLSEVTESMKAQEDYFPFDYYSIRFSTFADEGYSGYKKKIRSILIDSVNMNTEYATNDFIKRVYNQYTEDNIKERAIHKCAYRQLKDSYSTHSLSALNERITDRNYKFGLRMGASLSLENDLMIYEEKIGIDSKGTGKQVFIKTDLALQRSGSQANVILIEEPENHLSHVNLRKLIQRVSNTQMGQLFITTHSSLVSTRLELQNLLIMHDGAEDKPTSLYGLKADTAKYFMKAPVANVIEFALSKRVILVEGPSEYMLFERFYESTIGHKPENDNVHIMDVRGLSFKRYLEIAQLLASKVAVVTDNDHNIQKNCIEKYSDFSTDNIEIFYENNEDLNTFEEALYSVNQALCNRIFDEVAIDFMLNNKTEAAYKLLIQDDTITVPEYIRRAIKWINA